VHKKTDYENKSCLHLRFNPIAENLSQVLEGDQMFCTHCGSKNSDNFNFCSSCGKRRNDEIVSGDKLVHSETIEFVLRPKGTVLSLPNDNVDFDLMKIYTQMINSEYFDDVIFDAIFTSRRVLIRPVSKTPTHIWLLGALITPALAQTADYLGKRISSFLTARSDTLVGKSIDVDILNTLPIWNLSGLYQVKQSLPTILKAAGTIMSFRGISNVNEKSSNTTLHIVFEGSATPSKKPFLEFSHLAKLCNYDISNVQKI
jgi:hypothetical protein